MQFLKPLCTTALAAVLFCSCTKDIHEPGNLVPKTVDQDPTLPSIAVNHSLLHSEAFGHPDSTLLICIHGGPGGDYRYLLNCRSLAGHGYRVVFYDQRGSGLSQRFSKTSYTSDVNDVMQLMYDELSGVISHYRTKPNQKVILLGHSWGAMLATAYIGKYPQAVQGLIACEPGGLKWEDVETYGKHSAEFNVWSEFLNDVTYLDQFITAKEEQHEVLDYKIGMQATANDLTNGHNAPALRFWRNGVVMSAALFALGAAGKPDFSSGISSFNVPVLLMYSEKNKAYPSDWAQKIAAPYPSVEVFQVNGAGHATMITDPALWNSVTQPKIISYCQSK